MKEIVLPTDAERMALEAEFIELLALVPIEDRSGVLYALNEIAFPAGATRVRVGDVPRLIATAMYPNSKVVSTVIHSIALSPAGADERNIFPASMETMRMSVEISQYENIRSSISGVTMEAFSGSGVSINPHASGREVDDAFILIAALKDYCAKLGVTVRVADASAVPPAAPLPVSTPRGANNWDEYGLQRLLRESQEPGMTQKKLAEKYGVKRQRIAVLLQRVGPTRATPFDALKPRNGKK